MHDFDLDIRHGVDPWEGEPTDTKRRPLDPPPTKTGLDLDPTYPTTVG